MMIKQNNHVVIFISDGYHILRKSKSTMWAHNWTEPHLQAKISPEKNLAIRQIAKKAILLREIICFYNKQRLFHAVNFPFIGCRNK